MWALWVADTIPTLGAALSATEVVFASRLHGLDWQTLAHGAYEIDKVLWEG